GMVPHRCQERHRCVDHDRVAVEGGIVHRLGAVAVPVAMAVAGRGWNYRVDNFGRILADIGVGGLLVGFSRLLDRSRLRDPLRHRAGLASWPWPAPGLAISTCRRLQLCNVQSWVLR